MNNSHKSRNIWSVYLVRNSPTVSYQSNVITFFFLFFKYIISPLWLAKRHSKMWNCKKRISYDEKQPNNLQKGFSFTRTYQNRITTPIIDSILVKLKLNFASFHKLKGIFTKCSPELFIRKIRDTSVPLLICI